MKPLNMTRWMLMLTCAGSLGCGSQPNRVARTCAYLLSLARTSSDSIAVLNRHGLMVGCADVLHLIPPTR